LIEKLKIMENNKKVLIIGGTSDIGKEICKKFSKDDIHSVGSKNLDLNCNENTKIFFENNKNFYQSLIFVSGINNPSLIKESSYLEFEKTLKINCNSLYFIMNSNFRCLSQLKSIVVIGSLYSSFARSRRGSYTISKHGLYGLVKSLAIELSPGCNVNMVSPGFIKTKLTTKNNSLNKLKKITTMIPMNKLGAASDIANAVEFLTKKESRYITGINLIVDGGFSCGGFQRFIDE
jgi:NAD(P)-dependent dehydrogenase (short-subunit alcohol dehydrogenase family)